MKLLLDADGHVVVKNDKPVYLDKKGDEIEFDALGVTNTLNNRSNKIEALNGEAQALNDKLAAFGDVNIEQALSDRNIVKNLDDKTLMDEKGVDSLKRQLSEAYESEKSGLIKNFDAERKEFMNSNASQAAQIDDYIIGGGFSNDAFIREEVTLSPEHARNIYGNNFKVEEVNGKPTLVGYMSNGEKILSMKNPGEIAGFSEAFSKIFDADPSSDNYRKTSQNGGNGGMGGNTGKNEQSPRNTHERYVKGLSDRMK